MASPYLHVQIYFRLRRFVASDWHSLHAELKALLEAGMWIDVVRLEQPTSERWTDSGALRLQVPMTDEHRKILEQYMDGDWLVVPPASEDTRYRANSPTHFEGEVWIDETADFCSIVKAMHTDLGFEIALGTTSGVLFV